MNGTVTLEMALCAAGVGPGDEVIVPAISFVSTAMAVSRVGATPVFVDIEPLSFNMDPERAAAAITPRTKAIIAGTLRRRHRGHGSSGAAGRANTRSR